MSFLRPKDDTKPWTGRYQPYDLIKELCIAVGVIGLLAVVLTVLFSSPDDKSSTIAQWSHDLPANFVTAAATQLDGTSGTAEYGPPYNHNGEGQHAWFLHPQKWLGVSHPINTAEDFVIEPLETVPNDPALQSARRRIQGRARKAEKGMVRSVRQAARRKCDGRRRRQGAAEHGVRRLEHGHRDGEGQRRRPGARDDGRPAEPRQERRPRRRPRDQQPVLPDRLHQAAAVHGRRRSARRTRRRPSTCSASSGA